MAFRAYRTGVSLVRRRIPQWQVPVVAVGHGVQMEADLRTVLGLGLYRRGVCDPEVVLLERLLDEGDVFVDGGAHVGTFALVAAQLVGPSGRVVAFEPARRAADVLVTNIARNGFAWLELRRCAVTDLVGETEFVEIRGAAAGFSALIPPATLEGEAYKVRTTSLDVALGDITVDFLKLDLEGAEARALRGAEKLLSRARPHLLIEIEGAHLQRQQSSAEDIDSVLRAHGYTLWEQIGRAPLRLRRLAHASERSESANVFATARTAEVSGRGFTMVGL